MSVLFTNLGSTFDRGDFTDGNAFLWSSLDLSPYFGALGRTPHKAILLDAAGKLAIGYLAGVGADVAETLGSELITGWTNDPESPYSTLLVNANGHDIDSLIQIGDVVSIAVGDTFIKSGELYKTTNNFTINSGSLDYYYTGAYPNGSFTKESVSGVLNFYYTGVGVEFPKVQIVHSINASALISHKRVIDPPSTACHIVSALNGTTRAWASIESGFNPNTITSWIIYSSIPMTRIGGSKGPVNFGFGMTNSGVINSGMIR